MKLISLISSLLVATVSIMSISSSVYATETVSNPSTRTVYDTRDVNRDGSVNSNDLLYLEKRLDGIAYTFRDSILDANCNSIVSIADYYSIYSGCYGYGYNSTVGGCNTSFTHSTSTVTPTSNIGTMEWYMKYDYSTGEESTYYLRMDEPAWSPSRDAPGIIGDDDRYADSDTEGLVYIGGVSATGFIVDDHTIATAAHCVYNSGWITNISLYLTNSNGQPGTSLTPVEAHIPQGYLNLMGNPYPITASYDYALITVEENLSNYPRFALGMSYNMYANSYFGQYNIYTSGFPSTIPGGGNNSQHQLYSSYGHLVYPSPTYNFLLCCDTDLTHGNSGGPFYVKETVQYAGTTKTINTAISICSNIHNVSTPIRNFGPCIDAIMIKFYLNNEYADY